MSEASSSIHITSPSEGKVLLKKDKISYEAIKTDGPDELQPLPNNNNGFWANITSRNFEWTYAPLALVLLCFVTTAERVSFKLLVDRVVPFRFLVVILIVLFETIILCFLVFFKVCAPDLSTQHYQPFPRYKLMIMALLDLTKDFLMVLSGSFVAPTLTVMLLQAQIPISMLITYGEKWIRRGCNVSQVNLEYKSVHFMGAFVVSVSILLAFIPVINAWSSGMNILG
jgi:hypothetical protein